jgi:hypothetical protein
MRICIYLSYFCRPPHSILISSFLEYHQLQHASDRINGMIPFDTFTPYNRCKAFALSPSSNILLHNLEIKLYIYCICQWECKGGGGGGFTYRLGLFKFKFKLVKLVS